MGAGCKARLGSIKRLHPILLNDLILCSSQDAPDTFTLVDPATKPKARKSHTDLSHAPYVVLGVNILTWYPLLMIKASVFQSALQWSDAGASGLLLSVDPGAEGAALTHQQQSKLLVQAYREISLRCDLFIINHYTV